jgi:protein SCO1
MPARVRLALMVFASLAILAAAGVILLARPHETTPLGAAGFAGSLRPAGIPPKDFALRDEAGRTVSLRDYRGQVVVLTFMYSTCQDTCPLTAEQIRGALDQLGRPVPAVAISVKPDQDTPFHVHRFLVEHRLLGRMTYLTGTRAELSRVWKEFAVAPDKTGSPHSVDTVVLDRTGRQRVGFDATDLRPEDLAHDIRALEREG